MKKTLVNMLNIGLTLSLLLLLMPITNVNGAAKSIGLRPLKNDITINPGETITRTITVVNNTKQKVDAKPVLEKFVASDSSGYPDQMIKGDPANPQDATNWIELSEDIVTVPPFSTYDVEYAITAPENAEPGGHYAAILYEPYDPDPVQGIKIQVRVASLLLIKVAGDVNESAEISDFSLNSSKVYDDQPLTFNIGLKNTGNVHFKPEGRIVLKDAKGEVIRKSWKLINSDGQEETFDYIPVNYKNSHVLPQSSRVFEGVWDWNSLKGHYNEKITAELKVAYSDIKELVSKKIEFTLNRALEIMNFDYSMSNQEFTIVLKNKGTVLIKPVGEIEFYNSLFMSSKLGGIPLPGGEAHIKQGEERTYKLPFDTSNLADGKYIARYVHGGELDDIISEDIEIIIGDASMMAMLLNWQTITSTPGIAIMVSILTVIIAIILIFKGRKKKNKK